MWKKTEKEVRQRAREQQVFEFLEMPEAVTSSDRNFRILLPGSKSQSEYRWALPANIVFYTVLPCLLTSPKTFFIFSARTTKSIYTAPLLLRWKHFKDCREIDSINPISPGVDDLRIHIFTYVYKSAYIEIIDQMYRIAETYFSLEFQWYWI